MWSNLALVLALWYVPSATVDAQLFTGESCSICPTILPEVGVPDAVLEAGFAGVLLEDQTCGEVEALAQAGAFSHASCVLLGTNGISISCGCQEGDAPIPEPVVVTLRALASASPVAGPVSAPSGGTSPSSPVAAAPVVPPSTKKSSDGLSTGAIIGIVVGGISVLAIVVGLVFLASASNTKPASTL